jgi:hypothetical protein
VFGAIVLAVIIVAVLPVIFLMTGGAIAVVLGWLLKENGEATHEGSEFIGLNR